MLFRSVFIRALHRLEQAVLKVVLQQATTGQWGTEQGTGKGSSCEAWGGWRWGGPRGSRRTAGPDGKDEGWRVLGGLGAGEDIGVGALMDEEEFSRELEKNIPGRGHSLCNPSRQERAKRVLSHPGGSGTAVAVFVYLCLGWSFTDPQ